VCAITAVGKAVQRRQECGSEPAPNQGLLGQPRRDTGTIGGKGRRNRGISAQSPLQTLGATSACIISIVAAWAEDTKSSARLRKNCTDQQRHQEKAEFYPHKIAYVALSQAQQYTFC